MEKAERLVYGEGEDAPLYADVIVDISHEKLDRPFQYRVPPSLEARLQIGMAVWVPFGRGERRIKGYVVALGRIAALAPERIKDIEGIAAGETSLEERLIRLADWIRRSYGSTMIGALRTVLPVKRKVAPRERRVIRRVMEREELLSILGEAKRRKQAAKERLLEALLEDESIPYEWVGSKLRVSGPTLQSLERAGALRIEKRTQKSMPSGGEEAAQEMLSPRQRYIVEEISGELRQGTPGTYLIHGITGSGKTQVYISLIRQVVREGRQAIMLIPEIALTYQTLLRFYRVFGDRVGVMNSALSAGERYDQIRRAQRGELDVIIGPRSALFTPFPRLGLIVMDEEHEGSYKSESSPKYHAREVAAVLARMCGAGLVLGSATPSMESYHRARKGEYRLFTLKERLTGGELPRVYTVDLREELRGGNRSIFSTRLTQLLQDRLEAGEQSILFLNRRGYAGFVSCRACGHVMKCPHCDVSLSEHRGGRLVCHYCGYEEKKPRTCPSCGSGYILGFRAGTQQIEEKLKEIWPGIRVLRMDGDTTRTKDSYEAILSAFAAGEADVLVGTQMIVKGHDFPNVTLVGVLAADLSLSAGDYRAAERTFQLLTQAAGRAGRGHKPGEVVIQTYQPDHYAVVHAGRQDYEGFYEEELLYRELMEYPPASHMLAVQILSGDRAAAESLAKEAAALAGRFTTDRRRHRVRLLGPSPAGIERINDIFRFVFYVKCANYDTLIEIKDHIEEWQSRGERDKALKEEYFSRKGEGPLLQFDFDPMNCF